MSELETTDEREERVHEYVQGCVDQLGGLLELGAALDSVGLLNARGEPLHVETLRSWTKKSIPNAVQLVALAQATGRPLDELIPRDRKPRPPATILDRVRTAEAQLRRVLEELEAGGGGPGFDR